ncbi:MAG TPA: hypothetical protein GX513_02215 [Firmicutes bacterium]|nr:hypothetical protein [Bacillota bacterium]
MEVVCPVCGGRATGRVGGGQYYCWDCCVEFSAGRRGVQVYRVEEDGSLVHVPPEDIKMLTAVYPEERPGRI